MTTVAFLAEWALRSSILILGGALLLWALRVKDSSVRLAAWTAMLLGSLAIPALTALPKIPLPVIRAAAPVTMSAPAPPTITFAPLLEAAPQPAAAPHKPDWARAVLAIYSLVAGALLLRLSVGFALSLRLRRRSRATSQQTEGIEIRESDFINAPVTLGIVRPSIVLPVDWREWDRAKLDAVMAHERSHIRRYDPAVQLLSAIHRALLWHSPLSWYLHQRLVRVAEEASDDAAVTSTNDRALYAEVLLDFLKRSGRRANWQAVPMARYGSPIERVHRVLDAKSLSRGVTRWNMAAILALALPLAYLVAAARPLASQPVPVSAPTEAAQVKPSQAVPVAKPNAGTTDLMGLGAVTAYTVTIKSRVDGQLMSVSFKEGDLVQAGQPLLSIDPRPYQFQLAQVEGQLAQEQAHFEDLKNDRVHPLSASHVLELEANMKAIQARVDEAKLQVTYTQITSPITGVAGLLHVDPGNIVHASDANGIVVINQLQPISVLFQLSEDKAPEVLARLEEAATVPVEAWSRDMKTKLATGRLAGADNQIDTATGTLKFKAVFENKDRALFPNQFVNVRLPMRAR